jgi:hypothetical protein
MATEEKKVVAFDATLQKDVDHAVDIDGNGEVVLTSVESGHFIKFSGVATAADLEAKLAAHKAANLGQVTLASIEARKAEILAGLGV